MIDAVQPRLQAWVEAFLAEELPLLGGVVLNQMVPDAVDAHLRSAIQPTLDELVAPLVRRELVAARAIDSDASPTGTALKGAISSAVADRLATTFPTDTGEDAHATRAFTASVPTFTIADPIGAAPGSGNLAPHPEGKAIYLPTFDGVTGRPTEKGPPHSPIRSLPAGQKTAWEASRQKSDNLIGRAEDAHPARTKPIRTRVQKAPPTQKTTTVATGRREITAMDATGDTAMPGVEALPPMTTRPTRMIRASATEEAAARAADDVAGVIAPKRTTTVVPIRRRSVAARAGAAGLHAGATRNGLRLSSR